MVKKKEKERMIEFAAARIGESGEYVVLAKDFPFLAVRGQDGESTMVQCYAGDLTQKDVSAEMRSNRQSRIRTAHLFFKDGKRHFKRLPKGGNNRRNLSLKRYDHEERNRIVNIRGVEKLVLDIEDMPLVYYQPETARLPESLRVYRMGSVILDYSHIDRDHRAYDFVKTRVSEEYRM
ncbi:MAG: hypothetical protein ACE5DM_05095, partial [Candidatus Nanoarchaeia archaeon]